MRPISKIRKLIEAEGRIHAVRRGVRRTLHFENYPWLKKLCVFFLEISQTKSRGLRNATDVKVNEVQMHFGNLPKGFDDTRILLITDLHIDGMDILAEKIVSIVDGINYDYCVLGGDYSFEYGKDSRNAFGQMQKLAEYLVDKSPVFGVLGNHDLYEMADILHRCGVQMLMNETVCLEKNGDKIYLAGLDDCHYYDAHDIALADSQNHDGSFKIMISHSPECYAELTRAGFALCLSGHTHGGQVCLPGGVAVVTSTTAPRKTLNGRWRYRTMQGYTSPGVGTTGIPVRYNCPPEVAVITLKSTD